MKHIFTIHSPITFLISFAIIKLKNFDKNDVILLSSSGYKPPIDEFLLIPGLEDWQDTFWKKLVNLNAPNSFDRYIKEIIKDDRFIAYIDLMSHQNRILITNEKCASFNFIEEGLASYVKYSSLDYITINETKIPYRLNFKDGWKYYIHGIIRVLRGYSRRINSLPFNPAAYSFLRGVNFYSFSQDAFPHVPLSKKYVINFNYLSSYANVLSKNNSAKYEIIWIDDSFAKSFNIDIKIYHMAIDKFVKKLMFKEPSFKKVKIKMRPKEKKESVEYLKKVLEQNKYEVSILPNDFIIEAFLLNSSNCIVVGNVSSTLYYAALMGHKAYSMFNYFDSYYKYEYEHLDFYWDKVKYI